MAKREVNLLEWDDVFLEDVEILDKEASHIAHGLLEKGILEIRELKNGLYIKSNSYVGRIAIGDIQINISPKIKGMPLYELLKYTYGLKDLKLKHRAQHNINDFSFFDLIIYELYVEAEDLLHKGIQKDYIKKEEELFSPRGRIDIKGIASQGGIIREKLPCIYFNRNEDILINQILFGGLNLAANLAIDTNLKIQIQNLCSRFQDEISTIKLTRANLEAAKNSINRLTRRYRSLLEIISILYESQSINLDDSRKNLNLKGYFFDMNSFFENLIARLLADYSRSYTIKNQWNLYDLFVYSAEYNPLRRKPVTPRPDFALMREGKVISLLDAKYRDLWDKTLPTYMLYQLAVYASSGIGDKTSTIIYPYLDDIASVQKIDVKNPVLNSIIAKVILQPINLLKIADLLYNDEEALIEYVNSVLFN